MKKYTTPLMLALTLGPGLTYHQPIKTDCGDFIISSLLFGGAVTGAVLGAKLLSNAFRWSDNEILEWAESGTRKIDRRYRQIKNHNGSHLQKLRLFGNKNRAVEGFFANDRETVIIRYASLAPLHNAELIIQQDIQKLLDYQNNLINRNLVRHPDCSYFYHNLVNLLDELSHISDVLLASEEYAREEIFVQEKVDRIRQQRLDRERNEVLRDQAQAAREQARASREQAQAAREQARAAREREIIVILEEEEPEPIFGIFSDY